MTPYYEDEGVTIYHGDCRDVLPAVVADVVITDPPYGVGLGVENNPARDASHLGKSGYASYEDSYENFVAVIVPRLNAVIEHVGRAAVWTGPHIHEQRKPVAIGGIWHPSAVGRTPWGSKNFLPVLFYGAPANSGLHRPLVIRSTAVSEANGHPCPKPAEWMRWLIDLCSSAGDVVFDPFMGSGTTLVEAKRMGRRAIGADIEEAYCDIAAKQLAQGALFAPESRSAYGEPRSLWEGEETA